MSQEMLRYTDGVCVCALAHACTYCFSKKIQSEILRDTTLHTRNRLVVHMQKPYYPTSVPFIFISYYFADILLKVGLPSVCFNEFSLSVFILSDIIYNNSGKREAINLLSTNLN